MTTSEIEYKAYDGNLWFFVRKLTRLRWVIFATGFKRAKIWGKLGYLGLLLVIVLLSVGTYLLTTYLLGLIKSPQLVESGINLGSFLANLPGLVLTGAFLGILVFSFGVLLQALYLANDMDFLLSAPIPIRAVFLTKLLQAVLPNFVIVMIFCLPVLFGLGVTEGYNLAYYPLVLLVLASIALAAAGLSSLLVMAVVRFLPARRVAEIMAFVAAIMFMLVSQWQNLSGVKDDAVFAANLARGANSFSIFSQAWSPLAWGGRGLAALGRGDFIPGALLLALTFILSAAVFWLALNSAERLYYSGWASMQVSTRHKKASRTARSVPLTGTLSGRLRAVTASQVTAVMFKDFKLVFRDLRALSKLVMPLIMGVVFAVMMLRGSGGPSPAQAGPQTLFNSITQSSKAYGSLFIPIFVGWSFILNLSLMSFSMEGRNYWMLKAAPLSTTRLMLAKFMVVYLPAVLLAWLYMAAIAVLQGVPLGMLIYGVPSVALVLAGMVGVTMAIGVRYANMSWTDPRHMTDGAGSYLALLAGLVYLVVCYILFIAPPVALPLLGFEAVNGMLGGLLVGGAVAVACLLVSLMKLQQDIPLVGER